MKKKTKVKKKIIDNVNNRQQTHQPLYVIFFLYFVISLNPSLAKVTTVVP